MTFDTVLSDEFVFLLQVYLDKNTLGIICNIRFCFFIQACEVNFYRAQITISSVECYDPLKDVWTYCPELPVSRSEAGAIVL